MKVRGRSRTYVDVCGRMWTFFGSTLTYVDVFGRILTYVDVFGRTWTYVDVRLRNVGVRGRTCTYGVWTCNAYATYVKYADVRHVRSRT